MHRLQFVSGEMNSSFFVNSSKCLLYRSHYESTEKGRLRKKRYDDRFFTGMTVHGEMKVMLLRESLILNGELSKGWKNLSNCSILLVLMMYICFW